MKSSFNKKWLMAAIEIGVDRVMFNNHEDGLDPTKIYFAVCTQHDHAFIGKQQITCPESKVVSIHIYHS